MTPLWQPDERIRLRNALAAILFSFIILAPAACAISVAPSSTELDPHASYPQSFEFAVNMQEDKQMGMDVVVEGNLKDYINVDSYDKVIQANSQGKVRFTVNLPKDIAPGSYRAEIKAIPSEATQAGSVAFRMAVAHVVWFDLPFEGQHLRPKLTLSTHPNNVLAITASVVSDGTENVTKAVISGTLYSPKGDIVTTFESTESIDFNSGTNVNELVTIEDPVPGEYRATMKVSYDGKEASTEAAITLAQAETGVAGTEGAIQTSITSITGGQDSTLIYALIAVMIILAGYIILTRRKA
ncbi:MAG: hypothetical protein QXD77_03335 [Candidatus Aenigmatarchaeota archaeon]